MPYSTSMFMPRMRSDRPLPVPRGSKNIDGVNLPKNVVANAMRWLNTSTPAAAAAEQNPLGHFR